tara:strand:- start:836 stop:1063 length:228 start_codon:yes stop_codon:yes gene_type:complete
MMNRSSIGQIISTVVFYGVALLIFLKGMDFLVNDQVFHAYFSFFCAFLNLLAGMRFAIARIVNQIKAFLNEKKIR